MILISQYIYKYGVESKENKYYSRLPEVDFSVVLEGSSVVVSGGLSSDSFAFRLRYFIS